MFFKRKKKKLQGLINPTSVILHQLSNEELQNQKKGINHSGAVLNINLMEKEDILMVEKLKAYRAELEAKKAEILAEDPTADIEARVAEYKETLKLEHAVMLEREVAKIDSDIDCIDNIIAREEAAEVTVMADMVETVEPTSAE